jgi:hypothetical protein
MNADILFAKWPSVSALFTSVAKGSKDFSVGTRADFKGCFAAWRSF